MSHMLADLYTCA